MAGGGSNNQGIELVCSNTFANKKKKNVELPNVDCECECECECECGDAMAIK